MKHEDQPTPVVSPVPQGEVRLVLLRLLDLVAEGVAQEFFRSWNERKAN
jgi:hypothetical protein